MLSRLNHKNIHDGLSMKVFLVEDSPVIRERLRGMVASIPETELVAEADNEDDAVRGICAIRPDVVILDLTLARGSGMEVLRQIRGQPLASLVIVLTNYGYPQYQKKCMELGANYFMDKSRDIEILSELLAGLAAGIRAKECARENRRTLRG